MRKILVIGGNRYFGKRLVELLVANGDEVTVLNRGKLADPFGGKVKHLIADRTKEPEFKKAVEGQSWDLVYDQCGYSATEAKFACEAFEGKVGRYVFTSTQSVYLEQKGILKETDFDPFKAEYQLGFMSDFTYGDAKRYAESYFFQHAKFPVVAVRIPIVLGPDDYTERLEWHIKRVKDGRPIVHENLLAQMSMISSEDASKFLFWVGTQTISGPVNAASFGNLAIGEVLQLISDRVGKKPNVQSKGDDADRSPFVGSDSRYLDVTKASGMGFGFSEVSSWLLGLIDFYETGKKDTV